MFAPTAVSVVLEPEQIGFVEAVTVTVGGVFTVNVPILVPVPQVALQQILYNAVLHRAYESTNAPVRVYWFNDRIEISSPGGPYGNVTDENFGRPGITDYRNPNIADVLKVYGFIQAFGRGIATARRAMDNNGNPPIEFETNQSTVVCVFKKKS